MPVPSIHAIAPAIPKRASLVLSALNANRDGITGAYTTLITAGINGSLVPSVRARSAVAAAATSTLQVLRLWHKIANAGNWFLIDEVLLPSATPGTAVLGALVQFNLTNIALGGGISSTTTDMLAVTQTVAEAVHYSADQGDY